MWEEITGIGCGAWEEMELQENWQHHLRSPPFQLPSSTKGGDTGRGQSLPPSQVSPCTDKMFDPGTGSGPGELSFQRLPIIGGVMTQSKGRGEWTPCTDEQTCDVCG